MADEIVNIRRDSISVEGVPIKYQTLASLIETHYGGN